ncbi:hypothetical protein GCM10028820_09670 [Tessaracoccus terricola]
MTETHDRETPDRVNADEIRAVGAAWRTFERGLAKCLAVMAQGQEPSRLVLELAGPGRAACDADRHLELSSDGGGRLLRATTAGDQHLERAHRMTADDGAGLRRRGWSGHDATDSRWSTERPVTEAPELAADAVWLLRNCHRVAHPHLLTYRLDGTHQGAEALGLRPTAEVPVEPRASIRLAQAQEPDDGPPLPIVTTSTHDLASLVEAALAHGADIHVDFALYVERQPVFVRVSDDQCSVRLSARVVREVSSPTEARTDIRIFNRSGWLDWHVARRDIWVSGTVSTDPYDPAAFRERLEQFLDTLLSHRHALARRTGGRAY